MRLRSRVPGVTTTVQRPVGATQGQPSTPEADPIICNNVCSGAPAPRHLLDAPDESMILARQRRGRDRNAVSIEHLHQGLVSPWRAQPPDQPYGTDVVPLPMQRRVLVATTTRRAACRTVVSLSGSAPPPRIRLIVERPTPGDHGARAPQPGPCTLRLRHEPQVPSPPPTGPDPPEPSPVTC